MGKRRNLFSCDNQKQKVVGKVVGHYFRYDNVPSLIDANEEKRVALYNSHYRPNTLKTQLTPNIVNSTNFYHTINLTHNY